MRYVLLVASLLLSGCVTIKPWEKEILSSKLMQPTSSDFQDFVSLQFEKLPVGTTANTSSACPTCGG